MAGEHDVNHPKVVPSAVRHRAVARYSREAQSDDALLRQHGMLIDKVARTIAHRTGAWDLLGDLWTAGALGLLDAARRFDQAGDTRFETFAGHRIRGAMLDELRRLDHLPRRLRERASNVEKARWQLQSKLQREPSHEELAAHLGISLEQVHDFIGFAEASVSVDDAEPVSSAEPDAFDRTAHNQALARVAAAIATLPERLQIVLGLRYDEGCSTREIADILEVSEARVSQLHGDAIAALRKIVGDEVPLPSGASSRVATPEELPPAPTDVEESLEVSAE